MPELNAGKVRLAMDDDGTGVTVTDLARKTVWRLDEATRLATRDIGRFDCEAWRNGKASPLGPGQARREGGNAIRTEYRGPAGTTSLRWAVEKDRIRVVAEPVEGSAGANGLSLPGTFRPEGPFLSAVPLGQGVLHTGRGPAFFRPLTGSGHGGGYTLSMFGQVSGKGGLAVIAETDADASLHWEKTGADRINLHWVQHPSMGALAYPRETVIVPTAPDTASACNAYRRHVMAAGRFRSWDEKIAERPVLERLFGAAIVFVGYVQDGKLDYAEAFRRLKAMGVDRACVLPILMASTLDMGTVMGGPPTDLRGLLPLIRELGWLAGSFIYLTDGPEEGGGLRIGADGKPNMAWQIGDRKWFRFSPARRAEWARRFLDGDLKGLDAVHYDVLTCVRFQEDYSPGSRTDARQDAEAMREMLDETTRRGLIVSSEGFLDRMTPHYDIGSTKFAHGFLPGEYAVVPMTMLVYHDSAIHTWWEVDNYNNPEHRTQFGRGLSERLWWNGGSPRLQAAMDALMGTPPDIFPFGAQYNYVPHEHPKTYLYRPSLDSVAVRTAVECAKPVMALHERVGRLEMTEHRLVTPDGAVQETAFADGTRVAANFANVPLEGPGGTVLPPESWKAEKGSGAFQKGS